jgi:hypothetical protein
MSSTVPTPRLLDDWLELEQFARDEVKKHPRTVIRWTKKPNGLPFAKLGKTVMFHVAPVAAWPLAPAKSAPGRLMMVGGNVNNLLANIAPAADEAHLLRCRHAIFLQKTSRQRNIWSSALRTRNNSTHLNWSWRTAHA